MALQHLRSNTASKRPTAAAMSDGQIAVNTNATSPGLFFKDAGGTIVKVGPVHVGTSAPNSSPAAGGSTGNSVGEQWLDTSGGSYVFKVWDGSAWRSEAGEFVDVAGDTMTGDLTISGADLVMSNGEIIAATGTAAAPSITFSGDTDTGFYSPGANQVALATNGTGRLFVDASGNVSIGTALDQVLNLSKNAANVYARFTNNTVNGYVGINNGSTAFDNYVASAHPWRVLTNGTEKLRITSDGNVGIGTTSPATTLDVRGATTVTASSTSALFIKDNATDSSGLKLYSDSVGVSHIDGGYGTLVLETSSTERLRITSDGKVGIGTSSPAFNLDVVKSGTTSIRARTSDTSGVAIGRFIAEYTGGGGGTANTLEIRSGDGYGYVVNANNNPLLFGTNGTEKLRITSDGKVGIGTTTPQHILHLHKNNSFKNYLQITNATTGSGATDGALFGINDDEDVIVWQRETGALQFGTSNAERARIDSSGRLLVGTSSARSNFFNSTESTKLQVEGTVTSDSSISLIRNSNNTGYPFIAFGKTRGTAVGSNTVVQSGDSVGGLEFMGSDGTEFVSAGSIRCEIDGTPGANDMPGRLVFSTTADGASTPTERMRIDSSGNFTFNNTNNPGTTQFGTKIWGGAAQGFVSTARNVNGSDTVLNVFGNVGEFRVRGDGDCENTNNSYSALSDIKLKENVTDANSQWSDLKALKVRNYNLKAETGYNTHTQIGLIAQEVELVSPGLVSESPDRDEDGNDLGTVTKSVNYSVLYMKAVKALQEAMERIETLESSNADLLARVSVLEQG